MDVDKLTQLARFLITLPPERFLYSEWVGADWQGHQDLSCGTHACALGWAVTLWPTQMCFRIKRQVSRYNPSLNTSYGWIDKPGASDEVDKTRAFDQSLNTGAAVFDLTYDQAYFLFIPTTGEKEDDPAYVGRKILAFVELGGNVDKANDWVEANKRRG